MNAEMIFFSDGDKSSVSGEGMTADEAKSVMALLPFALDHQRSFDKG